ncbi:MAG: glycosyltransferase [Prevotellaceae bacterium]|jgi:glycosyltransferase involved in cell wall biosynthesis|nr:glycosyltransferase [Prevotellaceae bacterium]
MNILFINTANVSEGSLGGVNRVSQVLAKALTKKYGIKVFLAYYYTNNMPKTQGVFEKRIQLNLPLNKDNFKHFLLENQIDIIHTNVCKRELWLASPQVYAVAQELKIPMVFQFHMSPMFEYKMVGSWERVKFAVCNRKPVKAELHYLILSKFRSVIGLFARFLLRKKYLLPYQSCETAVLLSKSFFSEYTKIAGIKDTGKFKAIGNALSFEEFATLDEIKQKQKEVLIVCRLDDFLKNISLALKVWQKIEQKPEFNDWKFTIVGTGQDFEFLQYYAKKLKLQRCSFAGFQNPLEYYKRAGIFMMTSTAEGFAMTITEATSNGCVPVAFDTYGALHDLIKDGENGFIIPANKISAYVDAVCKLMKDNEMRETMAQNAVESSKNWTVEKITEKWVKLYENIKPT